MEQFLAGFEALKANIFDNMIEQQAKLGYRKEPVRFLNRTNMHKGLKH